MTVDVKHYDNQTFGWNSWGEFVGGVVRARMPGGVTDERLKARSQTNIGKEGTGALGGFAVPPVWAGSVFHTLEQEPSLLGLCRLVPTTQNAMTVTVPISNTRPWDLVNGPQTRWIGEGNAMTDSAPHLDTLAVAMNKLCVEMPMSAELWEDSPMIAEYSNTAVQEKMIQELNRVVLNGDGTNQLDGVIGHAGTLVITRKVGGDTVEYEDLVAMWRRVYFPNRSRSAWVGSQESEAGLLNVTGPSFAPYQPGFLAAESVPLLMGRPVFFVQAAPDPSAEGDLILGDWSTYVVVYQAATASLDVSFDKYFEQDLVCLRYVLRVGGAPTWDAGIAPQSGTDPLHAFVTLSTE